MTMFSGYRVDPKAGIVFSKFGKPITKRCRGYLVIHLNNRHAFYCHRMIWQSVNGHIPEGMQINHINGIKHDNRIENLELVTGSENTAHAYRIGLISAKGERNGRSKLTEKDVSCIRSASDATSALAERFCVSARTILDVKNRKKWSHVA